MNIIAELKPGIYVLYSHECQILKVGQSIKPVARYMKWIENPPRLDRVNPLTLSQSLLLVGFKRTKECALETEERQAISELRRFAKRAYPSNEWFRVDGESLEQCLVIIGAIGLDAASTCEFRADADELLTKKEALLSSLSDISDDLLAMGETPAEIADQLKVSSTLIRKDIRWLRDEVCHDLFAKRPSGKRLRLNQEQIEVIKYVRKLMLGGASRADILRKFIG